MQQRIWRSSATWYAISWNASRASLVAVSKGNALKRAGITTTCSKSSPSFRCVGPEAGVRQLDTNSPTANGTGELLTLLACCAMLSLVLKRHTPEHRPSHFAGVRDLGAALLRAALLRGQAKHGSAIRGVIMELLLHVVHIVGTVALHLRSTQLPRGSREC